MVFYDSMVLPKLNGYCELMYYWMFMVYGKLGYICKLNNDDIK